MLAEVRLEDALGEGMTKVERLAAAMANQQARQEMAYRWSRCESPDQRPLRRR